MTQLIVSLEDNSLLPNIKNAIQMLKGVINVKVNGKTAQLPPSTIDAIEELEAGGGIVCESFEDYLKLVDGNLPD